MGVAAFHHHQLSRSSPLPFSWVIEDYRCRGDSTSSPGLSCHSCLSQQSRGQTCHGFHSKATEVALRGTHSYLSVRRAGELYGAQLVQFRAQKRPRESATWSKSKAIRVRCAAGREKDGSTREDHYRVLGLRRHATATAIKTAFRRLARQYHPDVNKDVDADEKFKSILLAYEVLSDEDSRRMYDTLLRDEVSTSRRKQVYQRRDVRLKREAKPRAGYQNRNQYRRVTCDVREWEYSNRMWTGNDESACYRGANTAAFRYREGDSAEDYKCRTSKGQSRAQRDWAVEWYRVSREAVLFLWVVSVTWHALGAQTALTLLVTALALWRHLATGYRVASGVAWLMGGERGLAVAVALTVTTRVFGKTYDTTAAILVLALWLGGGFLKVIPLPPGAILVMAYKCIRLQSSS